MVLVDFLRANADIFAWSPSDMPGIPREVTEHSLDIRPNSKPVKQRLRLHDTLKMPGPRGVITVGSSFKHAYECDIECVENAEAQAEDEALTATLDKMASEALDSTCRHAGSFEPAEDIKKVSLDPSHPDGKALRVSDTLGSK